jgi:chromosome segregation ATPase
MNDHEAPEAPDTSAACEPELQEIISRWAGESRRLLLALPEVLAQVRELREEREALRNRLMDLEQENQTLRESRAELAETFTKMKDLVAGTVLEETSFDVQAHMAPKPDPRTPVSQTAPEPRPPSPEPAQLAPPEPAPQETPEQSQPEPSPMRFASVFRPPASKK